MPELSIIIPTLNRLTDLINTIKDLQSQTIQDFEVIIIDQSETNSKLELEKVDNRIIYIHSLVKSASTARNRGIKVARADVLLFIDDDVIINNKNYLYSHLNNYSNLNISGVSGIVFDSQNPNPRYTKHWLTNNKHWGWLFFPGNYGLPCLTSYGRSCNLSVRKSYAIEVGGMNESYEKGAHREESDFLQRVTKKYGPLIYDPSCSLFHIGNPVGGIRNWNSNNILKAQHHFDGNWYFIFRNIKLKHYPIHIFCFFLHFYNKKILMSPKLLIVNIYRTILGILNGFKNSLKSPRLLNFD